MNCRFLQVIPGQQLLTVNGKSLELIISSGVHPWNSAADLRPVTFRDDIGATACTLYVDDLVGTTEANRACIRAVLIINFADVVSCLCGCETGTIISVHAIFINVRAVVIVSIAISSCVTVSTVETLRRSCGQCYVAIGMGRERERGESEG